MKNALLAVRSWFQGKKTIIGGVLLIAGAGIGAFTGKLSVVDAVTLAGFGLTICGGAAKANRVLSALTSVAQAGVDLRLGDKTGALAELKPVAVAGAAALAPAAANVLHLSADSAAELQVAIDKLSTAGAPKA